MKGEQEILATRTRLLAAVKEFGERYDYPFHGDKIFGRELFYMALGALAFADDVLELPRPHNLSRMMTAIERDNEKQCSGR